MDGHPVGGGRVGRPGRFGELLFSWRVFMDSLQTALLAVFVAAETQVFCRIIRK
jgi:hypothetical protein